jgi:sensor domain CHASE-containing protein
MTYLQLNINQRINYKGYEEAKGKLFGIIPLNYNRLLWLQYRYDINMKLANELLTIRCTHQGYKNY